MNSFVEEEKLHRLHGLDFCRAVFMLLGLFYHSALIYSDSYVWRVSSLESSYFLSYLYEFIHAFRMEAFYLISGFFYLLVFSKRSTGFLNERLLRIFPPLLVCGLLINPIMNYLSYERVYDWKEWNYFIEGQWLGHLWFLGNLIGYFIISYPLCFLMIRCNEIREKYIVMCFWFVVPFFSLLALVVSKKLFNGSFLFLTFDTLFYYYFYFLFGCLCFKNKIRFINVLTYRNAILSAAVYLAVTFAINLNYFSYLDPNYLKAASKLSSGFLVLAMIAITYNLGKSGSSLTRELSDSSYTIYLLHQPLIVVIYFFIFKELNVYFAFEYILIVIMTFMIAFMTHYYFIKKSPSLLFLFNGVRKR
ncbi:acyltransferase family protein [Pseudoalteromonas mariniglutinosa]|uniref:acyltransferase family protein n=1 Tax=Pseudoalteromonas mariniglutinosa TaxID=206042 RepID=UPI0038509579